jgi:branched-chain amino acid transport system permease protein
MLGILIDGLFNSIALVLLSVGMVLVIGMLRIVNFAHGALYMVGSYIVWLVVGQHLIPLDNLYLGYSIGFILAITFVAGLGVIIERILRPLKGGFLESFILTLGLILFLEGVMLASFGIDEKTVPSIFAKTITVIGFSLPQQRLMVLLAGVAIGGGLWLFLAKTRMGIAMRAVAQELEGAALQGINIRFIGMLGMAIGCGLAAAAGALIAPIYTVNPYIGTGPVTKCFIVMVLGGIGSLPGAVLASFLVGFVEVISATFLGSGTAKLIVYCLLLTVMLIRPMGLYGGQEWVHR